MHPAPDTKTEEATPKGPTAANVRLPCRGCTRDCPDYATCEGRPWRTLMTKARHLLLVFCAGLLAGCLGFPDAVAPVREFDLNRYLGQWYEIARLDHSFEDGLDHVTAQYSLREDGGVRVLNKGFLTAENRWKEAEGKAYFVEEDDQAYLKVSFFGPFYGSYVVFELDEDNYQYAFVSGPDTSYLWLLSREPVVDQALLDHFVERAAALGFDTDKLIFPAQTPKPASSQRFEL